MRRVRLPAWTRRAVHLLRIGQDIRPVRLRLLRHALSGLAGFHDRHFLPDDADARVVSRAIDDLHEVVARIGATRHGNVRDVHRRARPGACPRTGDIVRLLRRAERRRARGDSHCARSRPGARRPRRLADVPPRLPALAVGTDVKGIAYTLPARSRRVPRGMAREGHVGFGRVCPQPGVRSR